MNLRSKILCIFFSNFLVDPLQEVFSNGSLEILLVHKFGRDLLILLHTVDKEPLQRLTENVTEIFHRVGNGRLAQIGVGNRVLTDGIEEKLVTGLKLRAKPFIEDNLESSISTPRAIPVPTAVGPDTGSSLPGSRSIDPSLIFCNL